MKFTALIFVAIILVFSACSKTVGRHNLNPEHKVVSYDHNGIFGLQPSIINQDQLFDLTVNQTEEFNYFFNKIENQNLPSHLRVFEYLKQSTSEFKYQEKTLTASQVMEQAQGNCMSLAILTTAIARLANVAVGYQLIDSRPIFQQKKGTILKEVHVRSKLYKKKFNHDLPYSKNQGLVIDYFPEESHSFIGNITQKQLVARYYLNIAVEFLLDLDYSSSYWFALKSLEYAPNYSGAINLMAVIFGRVGETTKAEQIYQYGINQHGIDDAKNKLSLLKNYQLLLTKQNRNKEALLIQNKIQKLNDPSPYYWLGLADKAYQNQQWLEAKKLYRKAIKRDPKLFFAYLGLSKTLHSMGNKRSALKMLNKAIKYNTHQGNYNILKQEILLYKQ